MVFVLGFFVIFFGMLIYGYTLKLLFHILSSKFFWLAFCLAAGYVYLDMTG